MLGGEEHSFDPFRELQLSADAEPELIKAAFKALAKKYHPDRFSQRHEKEAAEEKMRRINEAQRQLLSGEYHPPAPNLAALSVERSSSPRPREPATPKTAPTTVKRQRSVPLWPLIVGALLLVLGFVVPSMLASDELQQAQVLEDQAKLPQALDLVNRAIERDPRRGSTYLIRARLWYKMGEPERAATDISNARGLVNPTELAAFEKKFPKPLPSPSATPQSKGEN